MSKIRSWSLTGDSFGGRFLDFLSIVSEAWSFSSSNTPVLRYAFKHNHVDVNRDGVNVSGEKPSRSVLLRFVERVAASRSRLSCFPPCSAL